MQNKYVALPLILLLLSFSLTGCAQNARGEVSHSQIAPPSKAVSQSSPASDEMYELLPLPSEVVNDPAFTNTSLISMPDEQRMYLYQESMTGGVNRIVQYDFSNDAGSVILTLPDQRIPMHISYQEDKITVYYQDEYRHYFHDGSAAEGHSYPEKLHMPGAAMKISSEQVIAADTGEFLVVYDCKSGRELFSLASSEKLRHQPVSWNSSGSLLCVIRSAFVHTEKKVDDNYEYTLLLLDRQGDVVSEIPFNTDSQDVDWFGSSDDHLVIENRTDDLWVSGYTFVDTAGTVSADIGELRSTCTPLQNAPNIILSKFFGDVEDIAFERGGKCELYLLDPHDETGEKIMALPFLVTKAFKTGQGYCVVSSNHKVYLISEKANG